MDAYWICNGIRELIHNISSRNLIYALIGKVLRKRQLIYIYIYMDFKARKA